MALQKCTPAADSSLPPCPLTGREVDDAPSVGNGRRDGRLDGRVVEGHAIGGGPVRRLDVERLQGLGVDGRLAACRPRRRAQPVRREAGMRVACAARKAAGRRRVDTTARACSPARAAAAAWRGSPL